MRVHWGRRSVSERNRGLVLIVMLATVAAACSGSGSGPADGDTTAAPTTSVVTEAPPATAPPTTAEPELPRPVFDPAADHLMLAPVPPRPADKPDFPTPDGSADYMALFEPGAPWENALGVLTGFKVHSWMIRHYLTDDELLTIDRSLRNAGVPLIIEAEPLDPPNPDECNHSESFEGPYELENLQRLRDLGVHVAAIAIEQPHTYGVLSREPGACQYTLERTLGEVGEWIADAKRIYPDVVVGSIEGLWLGYEGHPENYAAWLDGFEEAIGEPLPFIHVDVDWRRSDWVEVVRQIEDVADARGVPFGVLYNGTLGGADDSAEWLQLTAERIAAYESVGGGTPQHVSVQSWVDLPDRLLPDDDIGAFTHLLPRYTGVRSDVADLSIEPDGNTSFVTGRIVDPSGAPVPGQTVSIGVVPTDGAPTTSRITGVVPDFATEALVLVRVHTEGASVGDTDVRILDIGFAEVGGENLVPNGDFAAGSNSWPWYGDPVGEVTFGADGQGGRQMRVVADPGEVIFVDGAQFPVTAGAEYEFAVTMGGPDMSIGNVGVAIAFVAEVEGARETIFFVPAEIDLGSTESESDGTFRLELAADGAYEVVVSVAGDATTWPITRRIVLGG